MFVHCYLTHDSTVYTAKLQNLEVTAGRRSEFQVQLNKDTVRNSYNIKDFIGNHDGDLKQ